MTALSVASLRLLIRPAAQSAPAPSVAEALEFVHFGLEVKYQLTTALARLRERGTAKRWVRASLILEEENNPSPPASPYPLPSERAVINCGPL